MSMNDSFTSNTSGMSITKPTDSKELNKFLRYDYCNEILQKKK